MGFAHWEGLEEDSTQTSPWWRELGGEAMARAQLLRGAAFLTLAGVLVKILGAAYRIPLARLIGEEGIGLYQMAYPIYLVFSSLSTAGMPVAISKLVAEGVARGDLAGVQRLFRGSLALLTGLGLIGTIVMAGGASWFTRHLVANPRAYPVIISMAPAVALMAIMSAFRGYFQGWQEMRPSGLSQLWEQGVRVVVLLVLAILLLPHGVEWAAAGAAFGATAGALAGVTYLIWKYQKFQTGLQLPKDSRGRNWSAPWLRRLCRLALPIATASILMPLMQTVDSILVPSKLQQAGYSVLQATTALGQLGNAWAVVYLPLIVTTALAAGLVPAISEALAGNNLKQLKERICEGYRVAAWVLPPAATGLFVLGQGIYRLIYGGAPTWILSAMAPGVFFLGWQQVTAAILQGLGRPGLPLRHFGLGCVVKAILTWSLVGRSDVGIYGAAVATVAGSAVTAVLNLIYVCGLTGAKGWWRSLVAPLLAAVGMGAAYLFLMTKTPLGVGQSFSVLGLILLLGGLYTGILAVLGGITARDLEEMRKIFQGSSGD